MPNGQDFDGTTAEMRDSPWLAAEDLQAAPGGKANVTIERVLKYTNVRFAAGPAKPEVYALKFAGKQRELALTASANRKEMARQFGIKTADWIGKKIQLYTSTTKLKGEDVPCIRIREASK